MNRSLWLPLASLAGLLALALWSSAATTRLSQDCQIPLQQAVALASQENWPAAATALKESRSAWQQHQTYLHIVAHHDVVDDAQAMYERAAAFADTQETSEFLAELADLQAQLRLLAETDQFSLGNVF